LLSGRTPAPVDLWCGERSATQITRGDYEDLGRSGPRMAKRSRSSRIAAPIRTAFAIVTISGSFRRAAAKCSASPLRRVRKPHWRGAGWQMARVYRCDDGCRSLETQERSVVGCAKQGGEARCLTAELDRSVGNETIGDVRDPAPLLPLWSPDGKTIYFTVSDSGSCHLYAVQVASCRLTPLTQVPRCVGRECGCRRHRVCTFDRRCDSPAEVSTAS